MGKRYEKLKNTHLHPGADRLKLVHRQPGARVTLRGLLLCLGQQLLVPRGVRQHRLELRREFLSRRVT